MNVIPLLKGFLSLRGNLKKSRSELSGLQDAKLRKLLHHAYEHSPYYRRRFEDAGISKDLLSTLPLKALPTMDKHELMAHYDELVTDSRLTQASLRAFDEESGDQKLFLDRYHIVHSSGSTGLPQYFVYDEAAWSAMLAGIVRGALWGMGMPEIISFLAGRPRVLYIAATDGRYGGAMAVGDGVDGVGAKQLFLDINTPLSGWTKTVRDDPPDMIIGYPSAIKILADLAQEESLSLRLKRIISCGEPLSPGMRKDLQETLHADVINFYGASESLALGVEGANDTDMTLFDDLNVIEVIDGEMYVTCLDNFVQPLIRYHISDRLTLCDGESGPFSRAELLLSRDEDMLWFEHENGERDFLHPLAIEGFCMEGLTDYQFVQQERDAFAMLAVADENSRKPIQDNMQEQMKRLLADKHMDWVRFQIHFVHEMLPDHHTGKKKLIIRQSA